MRRAGSPPVHRCGVSTAAEPWWGGQSWRSAGPPSWGHGAGMHMSVVVGAGALCALCRGVCVRECGGGGGGAVCSVWGCVSMVVGAGALCMCSVQGGMCMSVVVGPGMGAVCSVQGCVCASAWWWGGAGCWVQGRGGTYV